MTIGETTLGKNTRRAVEALVLAALVCGGLATRLQADLIYTNNFSTSGEQSAVEDLSLGDNSSIEFSTEQFITGTHSLKLIDGPTDGGGNQARASINLIPITDLLDKFTVVASFYLTTGNNDNNAQFLAGSGFASGNENNRNTVVGFDNPCCQPPGNLLARDDGNFEDTGFTHPTNAWFTVAMSVDNTQATNVTRYYVANGTTVSLDDFVLEGTTNNSFNLVDRIEFRTSNPFTNPDMYVDQLQIYNQFDELPGTPSNILEWQANDLGRWQASGSWSGAPGIPDSNDATAVFGSHANITGPTNVSTNSAVTVNRIEFDNASHSYAISGLGSVNLETNPTGPADPTIDVKSGTHQFQVRVDLQNDTSVNVDDGATLVFNNTLELGGNTLSKTGAGEMAIRNDLVTGGGTVSIQQGTVSGNGTVGGDVNNEGGTISPGNSPGVLTIERDYAQGAGASLLIEIAGTDAGVTHDLFEVEGIASLDGVLEVALLDGFQPAVGNSFDILDLAAVNGEFEQLVLPALSGSMAWDVSALYTHGSLAVVPEPSALVLMVFAATGLAVPNLRRRGGVS